jgi:hypothetical protein
MKTLSLTLILVITCIASAFPQVGIGTTAPEPSSMLDVTSTARGLMLPRMTASQRDAISNPATGLMIFCTTNNQYYYNMGTPSAKNWVMLNSQWLNNGSSIYYNGGNVGIGTTNPVEKLDINGAVRIGNTTSVCDAAHTGTIKFVTGPSGYSDDVCICRKLVNGIYAWDRLNFSGPSNLTCDDFDRGNSTTVTGWTEQVGDWTINTNRLQSEAAGFWQAITIDGSTQANGCITGRVIYPAGTAVKAVGLVARYSSSSVNIMAKLQDNTGCGYFDSYFIYSNNGVIVYASGLNFGTDAIIQFSYSGTSVVFKIDTNRDGTYDYIYNATVSNIDPGLCGAYAYQQCYIDNWCYETTSLPSGLTCDYFDRANSTTVTGWTEQSGNWAINSYRLQSEALGSWQYITFDGSSRADGCITGRLIYPAGTAVKAAGLVARYASSSVNIMAKLQDNAGSSGYFDSYFIYNNNSVVVYASGLNFGTDANVQLSYTGTSVTLKIDTNRDGTWDYTYNATVTNTSAGLCGVNAYQLCSFDNWCYGPSCP